MTLPLQFQSNAKKKCVFCEPAPELILLTTDHFLLMFDPFALVPGHLLIASREHYGCLGEVPLELQNEVNTLRELAYTYLEKAFKEQITRYEHGRAGHCLMQDPTSRLCHHYHEHLIPKRISLNDFLIPNFKYIPYESEHELCDLFLRYNEYLLVAEPGFEKRFYIAKDKKIEPHLLRTLSAESIGYPERQNWESYESCELMLLGKQILAPLIQNEHLNAELSK
ncbi:MAG: HIT domain-containing protein [Rhabdochlamydiaceae bacterium]|nr:HIT domain-containing protein [Rhabdochlamydiaceae bacterium]